jgi:hypothetical protein
MLENYLVDPILLISICLQRNLALHCDGDTLEPEELSALHHVDPARLQKHVLCISRRLLDGPDLPQYDERTLVEIRYVGGLTLRIPEAFMNASGKVILARFRGDIAGVSNGELLASFKQFKFVPVELIDLFKRLATP